MPAANFPDDGDRGERIRLLFTRIAGRYDFMNAIMSGGLDRRWRKAAAREARLEATGTALDVGTGTGDLAIQLAKRTPAARIVGLDCTWAMLRRAPAKARAAGVAGRISWVVADGSRLPFEADQFDAVTSSFLLRNVSRLDVALAEMARVTAPDGRVVALEFAPDSVPVWRSLFAAVFKHVVPWLGEQLAGDRGAYAYLPASVASFLDRPALARAMGQAGLKPLPALSMLLGSVAIHRALKSAPGRRFPPS